MGKEDVDVDQFFDAFDDAVYEVQRLLISQRLGQYKSSEHFVPPGTPKHILKRFSL